MANRNPSHSKTTITCMSCGTTEVVFYENQIRTTPCLSTSSSFLEHKIPGRNERCLKKGTGCMKKAITIGESKSDDCSYYAIFVWKQ